MGSVVLIGRGISHSASPQMHAAAFAALGVDHRYELADVEADALAAAVGALRNGGSLGANVTVPYKEAVVPLVEELDPIAEQARAVNTIVNRRGVLVGSNTDVPAIADEIRGLADAPRKAVILGAGGAARAVATALEMIGSREAVIVSRADWPELPRLVENADLLVNATPVGTRTDESPLDVGLLPAGAAVLDLVYRPSPTRLVRDARERGLPARGGAGVLLGQGWRSLEAWLAMTMPTDVKRRMADALCRELGPGADV